jgi:hypothetical protein
MKLLKKCLKLVLILALALVNFISTRNLNSNHANCSISSISIPVGSTSPVMVYNARIDNLKWRLTVLDKEQINRYRVDGHLFFSDKETGESWYADKDMNERSFESMRDAFSLCKNLNYDNKNEKSYESNKEYDNLRTSSLPDNVKLRTNLHVQDENKTASFLQLKLKLKSRDDSILDEDMEKALEDLEKDESPDLVAEQYQGLNNDAYTQNQELEHQIDMDNGNSSHNTHDLILD